MSAAAAAHTVAPMTEPQRARERAVLPCPNGNQWRSSCKKRTCPVCGPRWARDWWKVLSTNLAWYDGPVVMVSITAPGEDLLPWDETHCAGRHTRGGGHSGKRGCRVEAEVARSWSETATWRYADLRRAATQHVRKHAPAPVSLLARVWEPQKRGVPHLHLVLGAKTREEIEAAAEFVSKLKEIAPRHGFGHVDARGRKGKGMRGERIVARGQIMKLVKTEDAARYVASYLTGRSKHKPEMRELALDPAMTALAGSAKRQLLPFVWLNPALTSLASSARAVAARARIGVEIGTGVTMRTLRRTRHVWAWLKGWCEAPRWQDSFEAVNVGSAYWHTNGKRGEGGAAPPALQSALDLALTIRTSIESIPLAGDGWERRRLEEERERKFAMEFVLSLGGINARPDTLAVAA